MSDSRPNKDHDFKNQLITPEEPWEIPDPAGPVSPVTVRRHRGFSLRQWLASVSLGCIGLGLLVPMMRSGSCAGATRSSRLDWQHRQDAIDRAIAQNSGNNDAIEDDAVAGDPKNDKP